MTDPEGTRRQSVYMQDDLHQQVEWMAKVEGRSVNAQYVQMIREGIARRLSAPSPLTIEQVTDAG